MNKQKKMKKGAFGVSSGKLALEKTDTYYSKHKEKIKAYNKKYYQEHKKERDEYSKQYRLKNREKYREYSNKYRQTHPYDESQKTYHKKYNSKYYKEHRQSEKGRKHIWYVNKQIKLGKKCEY